jgi:hypothetical protein
MANTEKVAGVDSYLLYGTESTYGTAGTINATFGLVQSFSPSSKNNYIKMRGFSDGTNNGRDVSHVVAGKFEAGLSVELIPVSFEWLEYVLGGVVTGSGTSGSPYVYTGSSSATSLTLSHSIDNDTTDREELFLGCIINSVTIKAAVGEVATVTLDVISGDVDKDASIPSKVAVASLDPYTFVGGSIEIPNGSAISQIIDSVEITINNNAEILYGLGSRVGQKPNFKARDYTVKFTLKYLDETFVDYFLGSATGPSAGTGPVPQATIDLRFDNRATHFVSFVFSGCYLDEYSMGISLNDIMTEDITYFAKSLSVSEATS